MIAARAEHARGLLSALLATRASAGLVLMLGLGLVIAEAFAQPTLPCPFAWITGVPCPGCGMTRAVVAAFAGDGRRMIELHAFAPVVLVMIFAFIVATAGPQSLRRRLLRAVAWCEARRVPGMMLVLALLYWVARIVA